jgi:nucleoside-diphosphate-sugar epimerase
MAISKETVGKRVLITGATGFVGAAIARHCVGRGWSVRGQGRRKTPLPQLPDYHPGDLLDEKGISIALAGMDYVVHCAGLAHQFGRHAHDAQSFVSINVEGTRNVVRGAVQAGVRHLIHISSVSVYGPTAGNVCREEQAVGPRGPYAESKYQAEKVALAIADASGLKLTILRLATVYGEGDRGNVARLMRAIDNRRFIWIGDGSNRKSLIHCDDVARGCAAVLAHSDRRQSEGLYNVSGPPATMREIVLTLAKALDRRVPNWSVPVSPVLRAAGIAARIPRLGGRAQSFLGTVQKWVTDDVFDASKFNEAFNYRTEVDVVSGLTREVEWYRSLHAKRTAYTVPEHVA